MPQGDGITIGSSYSAVHALLGALSWENACFLWCVVVQCTLAPSIEVSNRWAGGSLDKLLQSTVMCKLACRCQLYVLTGDLVQAVLFLLFPPPSQLLRISEEIAIAVIYPAGLSTLRPPT